MADEARKAGGVGAATFLKASAEERKPSAAPAPASPARKIIVKSADMKEEIQKEAIDCALAAVEKHGVEKDIAEFIKKEFDKNHGPTWHCIVGRNFDLTNAKALLCYPGVQYVEATNAKCHEFEFTAFLKLSFLFVRLICDT